MSVEKFEFWDVYDVNRNNNGKTIVRGENINTGDFHIVASLLIMNSNGELLIQQRQSFKADWPNFWDFTAAGSAVVGESSQEAISRELSEELGLLISFEDTRPYLTINFEGGFDDFYIHYQDVDLDSLTLQAEEVRAVKWVSLSELKEMIQGKIFVPYYHGLIDLLFSFEGHYGAYIK
ncbi:MULTISPECIES: NUDIX hydrolase [Lactobacillales]|jgi:isopentenyldiphosphate isomerase|uniref:NUDIX domain-containing protein n=1 Tax=Weissella soli TaxID=155866 RepID=A0A288QXJ2_9LACO|nr:NUDIX domain-containing protein [Weissella soli]AOT56551.1 Isopentenyl-diphosphate Delta-isomerase [Weissella soli]NKY83004.1 NUDIX domain-containing protein [Weissella soli]RDL12119.1 NUDIX domain-containing protein [Weissella soli]GEN92648.1 NUDIX hydrolase [Weissella soli]GJM48472.1 NUDIX hydrolase [Weissella soli]